MQGIQQFHFVIVDADGEPKAPTDVIAKGLGIQHKNLLALLKKHQAQLERFGRVAFETRTFETRGGSQAKEVALLNEPQAALLLTMTRNTDSTMNFKANLVHEFFVMRDALRSRDRNLWQQMQELIAKEANSQVRASFGSHLMLKRKQELPVLRQERYALEVQLQPSLLAH